MEIVCRKHFLTEQSRAEQFIQIVSIGEKHLEHRLSWR